MTTLTLREQFANAVADYIGREMFPPHRGVIEVRNPVCESRCLVAFGNDGYRQDDRTRCYVDALLKVCQVRWENVEFGLDTEEGYTWAILVPLGEDEDAALYMFTVIEERLYQEYRAARDREANDGNVLIQRSIHISEILAHTGGRPVVISGWESLN